MEIKDILEIIFTEQVQEGIGFAFSVGMLWTLFVGGGLHSILELFTTALCG